MVTILIANADNETTHLSDPQYGGRNASASLVLRPRSLTKNHTKAVISFLWPQLGSTTFNRERERVQLTTRWIDVLIHRIPTERHSTFTDRYCDNVHSSNMWRVQCGLNGTPKLKPSGFHHRRYFPFHWLLPTSPLCPSYMIAVPPWSRIFTPNFFEISAAT